MIHEAPPRSAEHRQRVVDATGIPPAFQDAAFQDALKGTLAYQAATLRDHLADMAHAIRTEYRKGRQRSSERRPW